MGSLDTNIFNALRGLEGVSRLLDFSGVFLATYLPYLLAAALVVFILKRDGARGKLLAFFYLVFSGVVAGYILVPVIQFIIPHTGLSFPSGYAAFFFAVSFMLLALDRKWGVWFLILSLLMGASWVFVGVHYPSDIVGGTAVGFLTYLLWRILLFKKNEPGAIEKATRENTAGVAV